LYQGDVATVVDEIPVFLFKGEMPFYRSLGIGDEGKDVEQLQQNLRDLGYKNIEISKKFTWNTAETVNKFYKDKGFQPLTPTGERVASSNPNQVGFPIDSLISSMDFPLIATNTCGEIGEIPREEVCTLESEAGKYYLKLDQ